MLHAVLAASLAVLAADPFDAAKAKAIEVESAQRLLEAYAGACQATDPVEERECADRAKKAQAEFKGKQLYVNLGSGFERLMEPLDNGNGKAGVLLTPVIDVGAGLALTFSKPQKLDKDGTIIVSRVPVEGVILDDTMTPGDLKRLIKTGQVTLEIVGTVKGSWELKKKGGDPVKGVEMNVSAIRLSHKRTGKGLISQVR